MSGQTQGGRATTRVNKARIEAAVAVYLGGRFLNDDAAEPTAALTQRYWDAWEASIKRVLYPRVMVPQPAAQGAA